MGLRRSSPPQQFRALLTRIRNPDRLTTGAMLTVGLLLAATYFAALPSVASATTSSTTLYVDQTLGTVTSGCNSPKSGACQTVSQGVSAAEALSNTAVTVDVAAGTYLDDAVTVNVPLTDTLTLQGAGSSTTSINDFGIMTSVITINAGTVTIDGLTIVGGNSNLGGGGVIDHGSTVTLDNDKFVNNTTTGFGGGVANYGSMVTLDNDTFSYDSAVGGGGGGGVYNQGGNVTLTNSTLSNNSAIVFAGGVYSDGSAVSLVNDTLRANSAPTAGGISDNPNGGGSVTLANSLLSDNSGGSCGGRPPIDDNYNVADDATCGFGPKSISSSPTIGLLGLAANGSTGPETAAITATSSAFGEVPKSACTITTDERGLPRPGTGYSNCDAGAFELQGSLGYDLAGSDGGVFVFPTGQSSGFFGSLPGLGSRSTTSWASCPPTISPVTTWWDPTAGSSYSPRASPRGSSVRFPAWGSTSTTSWVSCPRTIMPAMTWWDPTVGSSSSPSASHRASSALSPVWGST